MTANNAFNVTLTAKILLKMYLCFMIYIKNKNLTLRSIATEDIDFLFQVENDSKYFHLSDSYGPYTKQELLGYIEQAKLSLAVSKQYRLVICTPKDMPIGFLDLYGYNKTDQSVGLGIIIYDKQFRRQGYAKNAIDLLQQWVFNTGMIQTLFADVLATNQNSLLLFQSLGFKQYKTIPKWNPYLKEFKQMICLKFEFNL